MKKAAPVPVAVHFPETEEGIRELARRVSEVYASAVIRQLNGLRCPAQQKLELLQAVANAAKKR